MAAINSVFLIDDDSVFNLIHTKLIKKLDFSSEVKEFEEAGDALEVFRELAALKPTKLPELIFLDINMPIMDGWEFLDELSQLPDSAFEDCRVIVLSSSIDLNDIAKAKSYRMVTDFISKPLTASKLQMFASGLLKTPQVA